jgi:hypothetical protein
VGESAGVLVANPACRSCHKGYEGGPIAKCEVDDGGIPFRPQGPEEFGMIQKGTAKILFGGLPIIGVHLPNARMIFKQFLRTTINHNVQRCIRHLRLKVFYHRNYGNSVSDISKLDY